jgi:hypothetical protein
VHDLVDPTGRHAEPLRETILGEAEREEKLLLKDLARVDRRQAPLSGSR